VTPFGGEGRRMNDRIGTVQSRTSGSLACKATCPLQMHMTLYQRQAVARKLKNGNFHGFLPVFNY
jgi:hypothetical protein